VGELAREQEALFLEDMTALGNTSVDRYARATDFIDGMVSQIQRLVDEGHAYELGDGYYFDIETFPEYGKLSRRHSIDPDDAVSRIDENPLKRHSGDFALWKRPKPGEPTWDTPLGAGRPGWTSSRSATSSRPSSRASFATSFSGITIARRSSMTLSCCSPPPRRSRASKTLLSDSARRTTARSRQKYRK
jgi:hypothetical protein